MDTAYPGSLQRGRPPSCPEVFVPPVRLLGSTKGLVQIPALPPTATPRPRPGVAAESARLRRCRSGLKELPHARGQGQWPRGATPHQRSGEAAKRSNPMSKERWLRGRKRAERSYSTFKVRRGGGEEIPLVQGKRNPGKMVGVARGHQRADTLKP